MTRFRRRKLSFWGRTLKTNEGKCCWIWLGKATAAYPYGKATLNGVQMSAHIAAWIMTSGPVPDGLCVCHHCDNPQCVRPDHLFIGTRGDNNHDAFKKGRSKVYGRKPLTPEQVRDVRGEYANGSTVAELSARFGRNPKAIQRLLDGVTYWLISD